MCGIIGYTGPKKADTVILGGLHALEYRGYDSSGIAFFERGGALRSVKSAGKIASRASKINSQTRRTSTPAAGSDTPVGRRTARRPTSTRTPTGTSV